jgi:hypothetical protein
VKFNGGSNEAMAILSAKFPCAVNLSITKVIL